MRTLLLVLSTLCVWLVSPSAAAHVVNLSQSDFTVDGANIHALVVFAKLDAVRLGRVDPNGDGVVTPAELDASQAVFRALVDHDIDVTADGVRCAPTLEGGGDVEGDGFGLSIAFACASPPSREVGVSMAVLRQLLPGHRHILRIRSGDASEQAILTTENPRVDWTISTTTDSTVSPAARSPLWDAVRLGVDHILTGWDHLLFLFALLLGTRGLRPLALSISAFTVAHSITLALAALDVVAPNPRFVEPAIAASIAYVAFENAWRPGAPHRWRVTFLFGLVHGFGFAGALRELALSRDRLIPTLLGFNIGVELGQLLVVAAIMPVVLLVLRNRALDTPPVRAASVVVGIIGLGVFVARVAFPSY